MNSDAFSVRAVVVGLILVLVILSAGMLYLGTTQTPIPDPVDRLAFLVAGAVAGILAKTSSGPAPVVVQNEGAAEAIPVDVPDDARPLHAD